MANTPDKAGTNDAPSLNFIQEIVEEHNRTGRFGGRVHTRFPPEPNGYLHIGHAKSICLNYGLAQQYGGKFNLRFDDTNPTKEEQEYVDSIRADVRWLGADWEDRELYASDYFDQLYEWAEKLIKAGKAYVCDLTAEETARYRGDLKGGKESPYRNRSVEENLDLFRRMKAGEFPDGSRTLKAKIDMNSPNFNLRDPVMYRILHAPHQHTGDKWCIYPMYDWAHGQSDSIEGITHSICTLEFENHRPLYDWYVQALGIYAPQQIEFARLNLTYTVLSKRRLIQLVQEKHVQGWDDPRMPTISGLRRRGYTPEAIRKFCERIGVSKFDGVIDVSLAGGRPARRPQPAGGAGDGRACGRCRWSSRTIRRDKPKNWRRSTTPKTRPPASGRSPSRASSTSSGTTSARTRPRTSSAWRQAARSGCATPTSSSASASRKIRKRAKWSN